MARTILDIRAGLIEEMNTLQAEVDERLTTIHALDRAVAALTAEIATPRPEMPRAIPDDVDDTEAQDGGNPFAPDTDEWLCYEALAQLRTTSAGVEVWRHVRKLTDRVIGREAVRRALYKHQDIFILVKLGWFRLRGC